MSLDRLLRDLDYPLLILTAARGEERSGCLVGFWTQCSVEPLRFLVCVSKLNRTYAYAVGGEEVVVHFVDRRNRDLAELFGGISGDVTDKFSRCRWERLGGGLPRLLDCERWFLGRVAQSHDLGDHTGLMLEPVVASDGEYMQLNRHDLAGLVSGHPVR